MPTAWCFRDFFAAVACQVELLIISLVNVVFKDIPRCVDVVKSHVCSEAFDPTITNLHIKLPFFYVQLDHVLKIWSELPTSRHFLGKIIF